MVSEKEIYALLEGVFDPEVPVLSIIDLGIVRSVRVENETALIVITPTYIGCPAMQTIEKDIAIQLEANGIQDFEVSTSIAPAWTTDWMTQKTKEKLRDYGISPPEKTASCPQCKSKKIELISEFGATACKSMYKCNDCLEPFEHFKCI